MCVYFITTIVIWNYVTTINPNSGSYIFYRRLGTSTTPAHRCKDFIFKTYAPKAFKQFRKQFSIEADDFLVSQIFNSQMLFFAKSSKLQLTVNIFTAGSSIYMFDFFHWTTWLASIYPPGIIVYT